MADFIEPPRDPIDPKSMKFTNFFHDVGWGKNAYYASTASFCGPYVTGNNVAAEQVVNPIPSTELSTSFLFII